MWQLLLLLALSVDSIHICGRPNYILETLAEGRYYISYFGVGRSRGQNLNLPRRLPLSGRLALRHGAPFMWTLRYPGSSEEGFTLTINQEGHEAQGRCIVKIGPGLRLKNESRHCARFLTYQVVPDGFEAKDDVNDAEYVWQLAGRRNHWMSHVGTNPVLSRGKKHWKFHNEASDLPQMNLETYGPMTELSQVLQELQQQDLTSDDESF